MSYFNAAPAGAAARRISAVLGATAVASLGLTGVAAADSPTYVAGNPSCASIAGGLTEYKIEPVRQGKTTGTFSIDVAGSYFDWSSATGVDAVIVKGGPNALVYTFDREVKSGTDLHAPMNGNRPYGLSHITFCYDAGEEQPPTTPQDPCEANPSGNNAAGQPCTPPAKDPCELDPSGNKPSGEPCTPPAKDPCELDPSGNKPSGEPCTPPAKDPCEVDPAGMDKNGEPCTPPVKDPCEGNPGGTMTNGEPCTPPVKDPCVVNPAGMDKNGQPCTPVEPTRVVEQPQPDRQEVLGAVASSAPVATGTLAAKSQRVAAHASLRGLKRCVTKPFTAVVRGRGIKRVTMFVNGKKVRTMAGGRSTYTLRVSPASARGGVIRVQARVEYVAASGKRTQTLSMTALRCQQQGAVSPRFAG